jgi:hypothetical protein
MNASNLKAGRTAVSTAAVMLLCIPAWAAAQAGAAAAPAQPAAAAQAASGAQSAVWTPKELRFTFLGFTAHYSCDGLRDKVRDALRQLGAQDIHVQEYGCSSPLGRPDPFPGVSIRMKVLQPATSDTTAGTVAAHWQTVALRLDKDPVWEAGDCELIEQIKQRILPLFAPRAVHFTANCVPHQLYLGTALSAELLVPDKRAAEPVAAR